MRGIKVGRIKYCLKFLTPGKRSAFIHLRERGGGALVILFCVFAGIWSRDIRYKSNLPLTEINKILKNLESKKLIKAVKSVAVS